MEISIFRHFTNSFHGNQLFCNIRNAFEMKDGFSPASGFCLRRVLTTVVVESLTAEAGNGVFL